jgi:ribonucleotide reductase alpha subunit
MWVTKRNGDREEVNDEKIFRRLHKLVNYEPKLTGINIYELVGAVITGLYTGVHTYELDQHATDLSASLGTKHRDYLTLASRIAVNNHHKKTNNSFSSKMYKLYTNKDKKGNNFPLVSKAFNKYVYSNRDILDSHIDYNKDYNYDYLGFNTLMDGYLMQDSHGNYIENPQDMIMRLAVQLYIPLNKTDDVDSKGLQKILHTYDMMSDQYYTHATPTLFNAGRVHPSLSSCFLLQVDDSATDILKNVTDIGLISKSCGGVGTHWGEVRANGSLIRTSGRDSKGIIPFIKIHEMTMRAFDQGGKRKGSEAVYLEMHHADIIQFLQIVLKDKADPNLRCPDIFPALWISDLFMERVLGDEDWSLFCPNECPGLNRVWGDEYKKLYCDYEAKGMAKAVYKAKYIFGLIKQSQVDSGLPYMLYKDTVNRTNMQSNIGMIKCSNLCVSGDTLILTDKGYFPIKELSEYEPPVHNVWNGDVFTPATFAKTGVDQELLEIETTHGNIIKCTPYHKFILVDDDMHQKEKIIDASELEIGDKLIKNNLHIVEDNAHTFNTIKSITKLEAKEDTYCFREPLKSRGVFNGLVLGNCCEILEFTSNEETAVCNLASICLPKFVVDHHSKKELELPETERRLLNHEFPINPKMNYKLLAEVASDLTENINRVIDITKIPVIEGYRSNFRHRPMGIGIQGLADVFLKFGVTYDSDKARDLNKKIAETIMYGSLSKSTEISKHIYQDAVKQFNKNPDYKYEQTIYTDAAIHQFPQLAEENIVATFETKESLPKTVGAYSSYHWNGGSPISQGKFHWELCGLEKKDLSGLFDWETLRNHIKIYGVRNSLTTAYMPTGTTSHIMGNSPCFEPYLNNVYKKTAKAGSYVVMNKYLAKYLHDNQLYGSTLNEAIIANNGSIQSIEGVPDNVKGLFKTAWEMKQSSIMRLAAERQPFIDQSQSMNLWFNEFTLDHFSSAQKFAWQNGLKTGSYYTKTRAAVTPQKVTISPELIRELSLKEVMKANENSKVVEEEDEICLMCSS